MSRGKWGSPGEPKPQRHRGSCQTVGPKQEAQRAWNLPPTSDAPRVWGKEGHSSPTGEPSVSAGRRQKTPAGKG